MVVASRGGIVADPTQVPLAARLGNVVVSYAMYLVKFVWPFRLSALYPFRGGESALSVSLAGLALILLTTLALRRSRTRPWLIVGWLWYLGMLVPVVGFVQQGSHAMADRYTYLSLIGIFVAVTWSLSAFAERSAVRRRATTFITVVVLLGLAGTTYRQVGFWRDTETLFEHAIACDPENFRAYTHAGVAYAASGDTQKAVEYYRVALQLDFTAYSAHNNLARLLAQEGRTEEALRHYELARHGHPDNPVINYNMGNLYARVGMAEEAIASYRRALEFRPEYHDATTNLALTLAASGDFKESESLLRGLLESRRHDPVVRYNLACVLSLRGDSGRALDWLREAVRLGFSDWEILDTDSDLENLRSTAAFQDWVRAR
jgi:Flp pilus assembly protein TadD